jgi:flagellar M-ring protein FliF
LIIAVAGTLALNTNNTNVVLFTDITQTEATEILGRLSDMGVTAATYTRGSILVPANQEHRLRAELVLMGYPRSGRPYAAYIDNVDMMSTDADRELYKLISLEEGIANTIRQFEGVFDAHVSIALGRDRGYVLQRDMVEPSAAVTVFMRNDGTPNMQMVNGIKHLVSGAVAGMQPDNVSVLDGLGTLVTGQTANDPTSQTARLRRTLEREIERDVHTKVMDLLAPVYGSDRVRVAVNASFDISRRLQELIEYRPVHPDNPDSPGYTRGVMADERLLYEVVGPGEVIGGVPGTETNAVIPIYPNITADGDNIYYTNEAHFQYLVSQFTEQIQNDGGELVDISVGIIIGTERMSRAESESLRQVVARAAGIDFEEAELKISIAGLPFAGDLDPDQPVGGWLAQMFVEYPMLQWVLLAAAGLLLFIIVLLILLARRARKKRGQEQEDDVLFKLDDDDSVHEEILEDDILNTPLDQARRTREMELKQQIGEFADLNPEIAAQLIKTWLRGGSIDG